VRRVALAQAGIHTRSREVFLVDRAQYLDYGLLHDLVLDRGDAERRSLPSALAMKVRREACAR